VDEKGGQVSKKKLFEKLKFEKTAFSTIFSKH
jgi:hypothetical protein